MSDNKLLQNNLLKLLLANVVVTIIMYLLYWLAEDYVYPTAYVPAPQIVWSEVLRLGIIEIVLIAVVGLLFRFKSNKTTYIVCNVISFLIGIVSGTLYLLDNPLKFLFLPFGGVHMICQYTVLDWELPIWSSVLLSAIVFCAFQNFFLLPGAIYSFVRKRKEFKKDLNTKS